MHLGTRISWSALAARLLALGVLLTLLACSPTEEPPSEPAAPPPDPATETPRQTEEEVGEDREIEVSDEELEALWTEARARTLEDEPITFAARCIGSGDSRALELLAPIFPPDCASATSRPCAGFEKVPTGSHDLQVTWELTEEQKNYPGKFFIVPKKKCNPGNADRSGCLFRSLAGGMIAFRTDAPRSLRVGRATRDRWRNGGGGLQHGADGTIPPPILWEYGIRFVPDDGSGPCSIDPLICIPSTDGDGESCDPPLLR